MKQRWVEWIEPYSSDCVSTLHCRMTAEDVVHYQKTREDLRAKGFTYTSDEAALDDFVVENWATIKEE